MSRISNKYIQHIKIVIASRPHENNFFLSKSKLDTSSIYTCLDFQGSGKILKPEVITSQSNAASLILLRHISDSFSPDPDSSTLLTSCQIN